MEPSHAASAVLEQFWDLSLPVDPIKIAQKMGISVYYSEGPDELSGFYNDETKEIFIQEKKTSTRQRFSVAHELGHAVLGHGTRQRAKISPYDPKERAANQFAATLLMPSLAVRTMVEQRNMQFAELCSTFDVSEQAMAIRLMELGLV